MTKADNCVKIIKVLNIGASLFLVFIGAYKIITLEIFSKAFTTQFFCVFMPFFLILFGVTLVLFEFKKSFMSRYFHFLNTLLGRGLFNLFLSSFTVYDIQDGSNELAGYIYGLVLFCIGILYIVLHFISSTGILGEIKDGLIQDAE